MLNDGKTTSKINIEGINVRSDVISPAFVERSLGAWFDSQLAMSTHNSKACVSSYYHLLSIRRIQKNLTVDTTKALVNALVTGGVDYWNF